MQDVELCRKCGTPRALAPGSPYCITCGTKWPKEAAPTPTGADGARDRRAWLLPPPPGAGGEPLAAVAAHSGSTSQPPATAAEDGSAPPPPGGVPGVRRRWPSARALVAAGVSVALVAGGLAFVLIRGGQGEARALALRFEPGGTDSYRLELSLQATASSPAFELEEPLDMALAETVVAHVVSVDQDGTATVELEVKDASLSVNGVTQEVPAGMRVRVRIARDGRVVSAGGLGLATGGELGFGLPGMDQLTPLLPDHPVEPGDAWTRDFEVPIPFGQGTLVFRTRNRFLRYEEVGGTRAAVIESQVEVPFDFTVSFREMFESVAPSGEGSAELDPLPADVNPTVTLAGSQRSTQTSWFDPAQGLALRTRATGSVDLSMRFEGFPEQGEGPPRGEVRLVGTFDFRVERLPSS
jgi:hypothetical protein